MRYGTGIPKWNKNELQEMDGKTRAFITMNKELHPRSDLHGYMFQRKRVEEDLLYVRIVSGVRLFTRQLVKRRNYQIMANEKGRCDSQAETLGPIAKKFQKSYLLSY